LTKYGTDDKSLKPVALGSVH